ncbi:hypothetical protein F5B19DRAFT_494784 [Rostrohypoxylon terebratum]|nr:hypothetical protein F5B19DRAFT_494784 [Rostrohypoxylon terebratum]
MGNSLSAESSQKGQRTTQKLSKPKTGNPTAAGLLSTTGLSSSTRPSPGARRLSLPHPPTPSTVSPVISEAVPPVPKIPEVPANVSDEKKKLDLGNRISRKLFRSNTFKELTGRRKRSETIDVTSPRQERWSSRTNSLQVGPEDGSNYNPTPIQGVLSVNASRTSSNYDLGSYEAKRLLNLVEEPSYETSSAVSGSHMYISESIYGEFRGRRPSIPETTPGITRANSEISLYTPMRRRSLMTPGIATREVPADPDPGPSKPKVRHSLPSTPARRGSIESLSDEAAYFPHLTIDPNLTPRALTPCEAEYKQTGAFKLGTLRITNGSPARSPARNPDDNKKIRGPEGLDGEPKDDYFEPKKYALNSSSKSNTPDKALEQADTQNKSLIPPQSSPQDVVASLESQASPCSPGPQPSPRSHDEQLIIPQIQVTSKHTAMEDELFDDAQNEYSSVEVLDVRVDTNAKSVPRPKGTPEKRSSREIIRADSGIASPTSEYSHVALSKADSGYSSSVSLRSLSSKPSALEKDRVSENEVDATNNIDTNRNESTAESQVAIPTAVAAVDVTKPVDEASPPPVPMKDPHLVALASPRGTSAYVQQSPIAPNASKHTRTSERIISPNHTQIPPSRNLKYHRASMHSPTTSNSSMRIGTGIRKPGKLHRFLSGSRAPLTAYSTHPTEYSSVPTVSRDLQARLQTHTGSMPMSLRRLTLRSAASKETLGTILSVGSAELLQDDDVSPKSSGGQLWTSDRIRRKPVSIRSPITHSASVSTKRPIPRKPVPIRINHSGMTREFTRSPEAINENSRENELAQMTPDLVTGEDAGTASHVQENIGMARNSAASIYGQAGDKSRSLTSLEIPPAMPNITSSKSPPPVSMRTRNMRTRRFSAPIRPQSTPPEMRWSGRPPYSRRASHEGGGRAPDPTGTFAFNHAVIPRSYSQENFRTLDRAQYSEESSATPMASNLRSMSLRFDVGKAQVPNWNVQADHGPTLSRPSSADQSRRGSFGSQSSHQSSAVTDPSFFQQQNHLHLNQPSLHRRSSYDEYNLTSENSCVQDNGPYPSMPRNGRAFVSDPWSGRSMSMPRQWEQELNQELNQYIRHPPYAPRRHQRHRSLDQYGNPMPYRVLHSYNSPAYRNVPIWR